MEEENKNKSLIGRIIDFIAKIFSIKQKKEKKKNQGLKIFIRCGKN